MTRYRKDVLEEAVQIQLEAYCLNELNDMVDYRTGEIMTSREYVSQPMISGKQEPLSIPFGLISSYTQMQHFMEEKDKRRMRLFNGCRAIYDLDKGRAFLERRRPEFSTPALNKLSRLVERLDYMNVIVTTPQELSDWVGVSHANLHRHLQSLGGVIRTRGPREGMATGSIKVEVSPVYGFKYEASSLDYVRGEEVVLWCQMIAHFMSETSVSDKGIEQHVA